MVRPSGEKLTLFTKLTLLTKLLSPRMTALGVPSTPHSRTVPSHEPEAMMRPSGEKHTLLT
jgi:hypothetical protein